MEKEKISLKFKNQLTKAMANLVIEKKITPGDNLSKLDESWTDEQKYVLTLFRRYTRITRTLKQLEIIAKLIQVRASIQLISELEIKYTDFIEYNLENYFMRITSIADQTVIMVSEFYNLGLPPQSTSLRILKENIHTKDKKAIEIIKSFDKMIQPIRKLRNRIVHRGEFNDKELDEVEANLYMLDLVKDTNLNDPILDKMYERVEELMGNKIDLIRKNNRSLKGYIYALDLALNEENKI